jgi:hypothetical protein
MDLSEHQLVEGTRDSQHSQHRPKDGDRGRTRGANGTAGGSNSSKAAGRQNDSLEDELQWSQEIKDCRKEAIEWGEKATCSM